MQNTEKTTPLTLINDINKNKQELLQTEKTAKGQMGLSPWKYRGDARGLKKAFNFLGAIAILVNALFLLNEISLNKFYNTEDVYAPLHKINGYVPFLALCVIAAGIVISLLLALICAKTYYRVFLFSAYAFLTLGTIGALIFHAATRPELSVLYSILALFTLVANPNCSIIKNVFYGSDDIAPIFRGLLSGCHLGLAIVIITLTLLAK